MGDITKDSNEKNVNGVINQNKSDFLKRNLCNKKSFIVVLIIVLILAGIGLGMYMTPANRLSRHLSLGEKYLLNEQYDEAVIAFNKAIEIDKNCFKAYHMAADAYIALNQMDKAKEIHSKAIEVVNSADKDILSNNKDDIVKVYLLTKDVYIDDTQKIVDILESGFATTSDEKIKDELVDTYLMLIADTNLKKDYEKTLMLIDRVLELDGFEKVKSSLEECLLNYVDQLISKTQYIKARDLLLKYKEYNLNINYDEYLSYLDEIIAFNSEFRAFMKKVSDCMKEKEYVKIHALLEEDILKKFITEKDDKYYVYFEDENSNNGIGCGVYKYKAGIYFYYGDYKDGMKHGNGITYKRHARGFYRILTAEWKDDVPNGNAEQRIFASDIQDFDLFGEKKVGVLKDGLWDGHVECLYYSDGHLFDLSFEAKNGLPTIDKTDEFCAARNISDYISTDDSYIYAYDNIGDHWMTSHLPRGVVSGVLSWGGYND